MEYTAEIFTKKHLEDGTTTGWHDPTRFQVGANSLEMAIGAIKQQASRRFPNLPLHINRIFDSNQKLLYNTAWDELGPLASVLGEESK